MQYRQHLDYHIAPFIGSMKLAGPATEQMIEWYKKMFRDCMEPEVLSWDDASNNQSLQQGKAGWIHNQVSAYIVAKQMKLPTADTINHHKTPGGPKGRHDAELPRRSADGVPDQAPPGRGPPRVLGLCSRLGRGVDLLR